MMEWGSEECVASTSSGEGIALQETEPGPDVEEDVHNLDEQKPVYVGPSHGYSGFKRMYKFDGSRRVVVPPALDLSSLTDDEAECLRLAALGRYDEEMMGGLLIGPSISDGGGTMIPLTPTYGPDNTVDFFLPSHILHGSSLRVSNLVYLGLASSNHGVSSVLQDWS
jgi:hypothetical protein